MGSTYPISIGVRYICMHGLAFHSYRLFFGYQLSRRHDSGIVYGDGCYIYRMLRIKASFNHGVDDSPELWFHLTRHFLKGTSDQYDCKTRECLEKRGMYQGY